MVKLGKPVEALRLAPKHATAHRCLGDALVVMKSPAEALDCYGEALRLRFVL